MEQNVIDLLNLILEENREINRNSKEMSSSIQALSESVKLLALHTDRKLEILNQTVDTIAIDLSRLRTDLKEIENIKINKLDDRITRLEAMIFKTGA